MRGLSEEKGKMRFSRKDILSRLYGRRKDDGKFI